MSEEKDYYGTLGLDEDASMSEVQHAYRRLIRQYHPDLNPDPDAEGRFKEIAEAYAVLIDSDARVEYDKRTGRRPRRRARRSGLHIGLDLGILRVSVGVGETGEGSLGPDERRRKTHGK